MNYFAFPIFQPSGVLTRGIPFLVHGDKSFCPICGTDLEDEFIPGFGFAYGGFGRYWYCTSDDCQWFYKEMEAA